jgi:hypothetical protein
MKWTILTLLVFCCVVASQAQGLRGKVFNEEGEPLPYASVYFRNLGDGVPTNQQGEFRYALRPGVYDVLVQFIGYESVLRTVEIADQWVEMDFRLKEQVFALQEVVVQSGQEDPALTVMRKAISKAKFHRLQVQQYSMQVYLKGTGKLTNAPFFLKKKLKEEGLNLNEAYTSESVSEITFTQPNKLEERVISIRTSGENNQTSPAPYIGTSFYNEKINGAISPLSRQAFAYYRFTLMGSFMEGDVLVNKVRVTPRSKGENVFEGYIYIIEDLWAIHSLDLKTSIMGFRVNVNQIYAPVKEHVWMPTTHTYVFGGKIFGFAGEYTYLASVRDYEVTLNPDLEVEPEIIDEKVQEVPQDVVKFDKRETSLRELEEGDKLTRKEFRKMVNEYEKESLRKREDADVVRETSRKVDSLATKRGESYWENIRPIQLTEEERHGYKRDDSLALVEEAKLAKKDTANKDALNRKFDPMKLLLGGTHHFGGGWAAGSEGNIFNVGYNTVEGRKFALAGFLRHRKVTYSADSANKKTADYLLRPEFRYGFSSQRPYLQADLRRQVQEQGKNHVMGLTGGRFIFQFNHENPISEVVNSFYTLFLRQNFIKFYEEDFVKVYHDRRVNDKISFGGSFRWSDRRELFNQSERSWFYEESRGFTPNRPVNVEAGEEAFENQQALVFAASARWRPGVKYGIRNGRRYPIYDRAPEFNFGYTKGIPGITGANGADFDLVELGVAHGFVFGVSGRLDFNVNTGAFLNDRQVHFSDFKHFGGNRTIFSNMGVASNYRFMDYYMYSTRSNFVSSIVHYQFRKFLLTQLPMLRYTGVREALFFNYLKTENSPHYMEVGYSLDQLFRIFRVEFGAGFENGRYSTTGVRFGVASFININ